MIRGVSSHTSHLLQYGFFTVLFVGTIVLAFFLVKPFLPAIFLALILAVFCYPFYLQTTRAFKGHEGLAALATVLVVLTLIVTPAVFFGLLLFEELMEIYEYVLSPAGVQRLQETVVGIENGVRSAFPNFEGIREYADPGQYVRMVIEWIADHLGALFSGAFKMILNLILMFLALLFFLREGGNIMRKLVQLSPLDNAHDEMILSKIAFSINTVLKGRLMIAVIQGIFSAIGLALFGVPNPVFLGFVAAFCSLVPTVGTALVMAPAALYLFFAGEFAAFIGLSAWSFIAVGLIDDILGPYLIEKDMKIHPFLILISALGGIQFFGLIGFIAGPVLLAVLFVLGEIYILLTKPVVKASRRPRKA